MRWELRQVTAQDEHGGSTRGWAFAPWARRRLTLRCCTTRTKMLSNLPLRRPMAPPPCRPDRERSTVAATPIRHGTKEEKRA